MTGSGALDVDALLAAAAAETGLSDFGEDISAAGDRFREGLGHYLEDINAEIAAAPHGLEPQRMFVHKALVNRLRLHEDLRRHPEIADEPVDDPIYLIGLPRTGTTKLFRMLSVDPGVQRLAWWQALNPAPLPGAGPGVGTGEPDPRIAVAHEYESAMSQHFPEFWAMHAMATEGAEEDLILQEYSFQTPFLAVRSGAHPTYLPWLQATDPEHRAAYRYSRLLLQYLQWQDPANRSGARGRPWVLKNVAVFGNLPTLLETHPRAVLIQCHRDPRVAVASMLKLFELVRAAFTLRTDFDLVEHGQAFLRFFAGQAQRNVEQRTALGPDVPIIDVHYQDIRRDPFAVMRRIHELRGTEFTPDALDAAKRWDAENPQHRFGRVEYSLDRYGLTADGVADAFRPYIDHFELPLEATT